MCAAPTPPASCRWASGITGCPAPTTPRPRWSTSGREKEKVEVSIDYITSQGNKNLLTIAAEAQAQSGHDIFAFPTWEPQAHAKNLEPVDDIMAELIKQNGPVNPTVDYLARADGRWLAVPATRRQPDQGAVLAHRSDEEARRHRRGRDVSGRRRRRRPRPGRSTPCSRPPRPATRRASPSASGSAPPRTTSTRRARSSSRSAPTWSTPRATSRSRPMRCARRSTTTRSSRSSCRRTRRPGTTPPTTSG